MRRKTLYKAKLIVTVKSDKKRGKILTVSVFDNRAGEYWPEECIHKRGIVWFMNMDDMKETLNWNLNGDSSKYQFKWGQTAKGISEGRAYIFD